MVPAYKYESPAEGDAAFCGDFLYAGRLFQDSTPLAEQVRLKDTG